MQINLTIKDTLYAKEVDAVAAMKGWTPTIPDPAFVPTETKTEAPQVPNITKDRFFKQQVKIWARNQAIEHANMVALSNVSIEADA